MKFSISKQAGFNFKSFGNHVKFKFDSITEDEFCNKIAVYTHSQITFFSNIRQESHFISSCGLIFDFDSKVKPGKLNDFNSSIEQFLSSEVAKRLSFILYTSKSHQKNGNGDCFHVFFPFIEDVNSRETYRISMINLYNYMISLGLSCDSDALKGDSRLIGPSISHDICKSEWVDNKPMVIKHVGDMYTPTATIIDYHIGDAAMKYTTKGDLADYEYTYEAALDGSFVYGQAFNFIDRTYAYSIVSSFCTYMNQKNRDSGWTLLSSGAEWRKFGQVFHNLFGYEMGYRLFHKLSAGWTSPDGTSDTYSVIRNAYNYVANDKNQKRGFAAFMNLTAQYGYLLNVSIAKAIISKVTNGNTIPLNDLVCDLIKEFYDATSVTLIKYETDNDECLYADLVHTDGQTECIRFGHTDYIHMMSQKFNLNRKLFHKSYKQLCNMVTDKLNFNNIVISRLSKVMAKFKDDDVFFTRDLRTIITNINKEYKVLQKMRVDYDSIIKILFNKGFISSLEETSVWVNSKKRMLNIFVCKNALNTDKRINDLLTDETVVKPSRSYVKHVDDGYIGITSTDVVYTITTEINGEQLSQVFKDGSMPLSKAVCSGVLRNHIISQDPKFIHFLNSIHSPDDYILQFHWDISNKKASKAIRRERNDHRSKQYIQSRKKLMNPFRVR